MIYKRLFRAEPVEDPRFLVGRDIEMQALAEANEMWQKGHAMAVALTGERGSGKTSLLNCSVLRLFQNSPVVRGQLSQRIRSREDMRAYLRGLLDLPKNQDLISALRAERRVVILEEVERAFLRTIDGFDPVREFLHVVSRTNPNTLWILSLNRAACKLLDRAVEFSQYFSHRIDAMRVEPEDLKNAILLRHNLSGLRLHFAPLPHRFPALDPIRRSVGLLVDPQDFFFEWLHRQSEGVFRAAFDLWHRHILGAEGGVLYLAGPNSSDSESPLNDCSREDLFTLQAIRQHGSLTVAEHAEVFSSTTQASEMQIERLADREILEPEPNATGWRVSTEAGYLVRRALDAENLL